MLIAMFQVLLFNGFCTTWNTSWCMRQHTSSAVHGPVRVVRHDAPFVYQLLADSERPLWPPIPRSQTASKYRRGIGGGRALPCL